MMGVLCLEEETTSRMFKTFAANNITYGDIIFHKGLFT